MRQLFGNRKAFTLIELLVVVGIIAVLISIMLPGIGRARAKAQATVCGTHVRGLSQAMIMYCSDFGGRLPLDGGDGESGPQGSGIPIGVWSDPSLWFNALTNYAGAGAVSYDQMQLNAVASGDKFRLPPKSRGASLFVCASAFDAQSNQTQTGDVVENGFFMTNGYFAISSGGPFTEVRPMLLCYGMNSQLRTKDYKSWQTYYQPIADPNDIKNLNDLKPAYLVPLFAEKRIRQDELPQNHPSYGKALTQNKVTANRFTTRHDKGGNIVFADGHVEMKKNAEIDNSKALKVNYYNIRGLILWNPSQQ